MLSVFLPGVSMAVRWSRGLSGFPGCCPISCWLQREAFGHSRFGRQPDFAGSCEPLEVSLRRGFDLRTAPNWSPCSLDGRYRLESALQLCDDGDLKRHGTAHCQQCLGVSTGPCLGGLQLPPLWQLVLLRQCGIGSGPVKPKNAKPHPTANSNAGASSGRNRHTTASPNAGHNAG